jgi:hypothetical protein
MNGSRSLRLRPSLAIVPQAMPPLAPAVEARVRDHAARLRRNSRDFDPWRGWGGNVGSGIAPGPAVLYEDYSPIALYEGFGQEYRALPLAGSGDIVLVSETRQPAFETYCRDRLKLGEVTVASVTARRRTRRQSLAVQACDDSATFARLCDIARVSGTMTVMPYMGTGGSWLLAGRIAERTGSRVLVAAPPPNLARLVNDKLWFGTQVAALLGKEALPPTFAAYGMAALTGRLRALARHSHRVVVKVPESAGGMGNVSLASDDVLRLAPAELGARIEALLAGRGWTHTFPLMAGVWETDILDNPSVQLWIPHEADGPPLVEGVFSQSVSLQAGEFLGVAPSDLPAPVQQRLAEEARAIARLWQRLGYFGRCSFDAILVGDSPANACVHWIECNGRWGGASVPMSLANRLTGNWARQTFMTFHVRGPANGPLADVAGTLARLDDILFDPVRRPEGIVLVVPTLTRRGAGMNFLVLAASPAAIDMLRRRTLAAVGAAPAD